MPQASHATMTGYSDWMQNNYLALQHMQLCNLPLLGSHDAYGDTINVGSRFVTAQCAVDGLRGVFFGYTRQRPSERVVIAILRHTALVRRLINQRGVPGSLSPALEL